MKKEKEIIIGDRKVGLGHAPFVIAEMSGNHNQSLERAMELIEAAAATGAHAIKLQTYTADTMTIDETDGDFFINDTESLWHGRSLYELYEEAYTPWEWHKPIMDRCKELGIMCFSTPFDVTAVDFLEELGVPCYKVASFENIDLPLIRKIASTGKPIIMSTGMATPSELYESVNAAKEAGCEDLILLKCTSSYPATPENSNIRTIPHMRELFGCEVGLSDHSLGTGVAVASVALGATVVEKHFTLCRADGGVDSAFSMEPDEMKALVVETERAWQALGQVTYGARGKETSSMRFRRSLYVVEDVQEGEELTQDNIRAIRPGWGLPPKYIENIIGKQAGKALKRGTPVSWDIL